MKRNNNVNQLEIQNNKKRRVQRLNTAGPHITPEEEEDFLNILLGNYYENIDNWEYEEIKCNPQSIQDLIDLGKKYNPNEKKRYNIDLKTLNKLIEPLTKLNNLIGMNDSKEAFLNLIIMNLQKLNESKDGNMLHTVIEGPPGCGKTELANILAEIYANMGILTKNHVEKVKRSDLIGQYLGQTAIKTQKAIDKSLGGVLLIDEGYALGHPEGRDSFSKECIDTLNQNLSENKKNLVVIIVGYKDALERSFFAMNEGLKRRFPFRFSIRPYKEKELFEIFKKKIKEEGWNLYTENEININFFKDKLDYFKFFGGDIETLFQMAKITHARRVFSLNESEKKKLTKDDIIKGFEMFCNNDEVKSRSNNNESLNHIYL
jgi:SpoVK/Ycf46/Vps4 family AAA+-type ATPase